MVWDDTAQAWLVLGYQAAREVLGGAGWTSDPLANPLARAAIDRSARTSSPGSMLFADGASHAGYATRCVTCSPVLRRRPAAGVEAIAAARSTSPKSVCRSISWPTSRPAATDRGIAGWLDLEPATARLLRELSPAIIRMLGALADSRRDRCRRRGSAALMAEFLPLAADRRTHPGDDLLSFIAADPDARLDEVVVTAILIAVAGHETTANMLGAGIVTLLTLAEDGSRVLDRIDPADPALVTELLRLRRPGAVHGAHRHHRPHDRRHPDRGR